MTFVHALATDASGEKAGCGKEKIRFWVVCQQLLPWDYFRFARDTGGIHAPAPSLSTIGEFVLPIIATVKLS
jgi:hypothetical protein